MLGFFTTLPSSCSICWTRCFLERSVNHAGASGRWCRCDTARLHFFHNKALTLIQRGQLDEMSEHWPMLEGPKDVTGEAKVQIVQIGSIAIISSGACSSA